MRLNSSVSGPGLRQNGESWVFAPICSPSPEPFPFAAACLEIGSAFSCFVPSCEDPFSVAQDFFFLLRISLLHFTSLRFPFLAISYLLHLSDRRFGVNFGCL